MIDKFTKKQIIFLIGYPFIHLILSIIFLFMALAKGFMHDDPDWHPTRTQEVMAAVGTAAVKILWAPLFFWERAGLPVSHQTFGEYFAIFLCGLLYGLIGVIIYKIIYRR